MSKYKSFNNYIDSVVTEFLSFIGMSLDEAHNHPEYFERIVDEDGDEFYMYKNVTFFERVDRGRYSEKYNKPTKSANKLWKYTSTNYKTL